VVRGVAASHDPSSARLWKDSKLKALRRRTSPPTDHTFPSPFAMPNIAPTIARQVLRIAPRRYPSSAFARVSPRVAASGARRNYVSETKPASATVNVDTAIKADQKAFLKQTGTRPQDAIMPTTGMSADVMMSPTAGAPPLSFYILYHTNGTRPS
jgi:hypothetical protein